MSCNSEKITTEIKRGSTFEQSISLLDENGDVVNSSSWFISSDLKKSPDDEVLLSFAIDSTQAESGIVGISASPTETLSLPANLLLQYDLKFEIPNQSEIECGYWDQAEIWEESEDWYFGPIWYNSEDWEAQKLWICDHEGGNADVYYTETLYLKTSRHITD